MRLRQVSVHSMKRGENDIKLPGRVILKVYSVSDQHSPGGNVD